MTCDVSSSTYPDADFGPEAYGRYGEAWRWRIAGLAIMATSSVVSTAMYWNLGLFLIAAS